MLKQTKATLKDSLKMLAELENVMKEVSNCVRAIPVGEEVEALYTVLKDNGLWVGKGLGKSKKKPVVNVTPEVPVVEVTPEVPVVAEALSKVEEITLKALEVVKANPAPTVSEYLNSTDDDDLVFFEEESEFPNLNAEGPGLVVDELTDEIEDEEEYEEMDDDEIGQIETEEDITSAVDTNQQDNFVLPVAPVTKEEPKIVMNFAKEETQDIVVKVEAPENVVPEPPVTPVTPAVKPSQDIYALQMQLEEMEGTLNNLVPTLTNLKLKPLNEIKSVGEYLKFNCSAVDADTSREQLYGDDRKDLNGNYVYGSTKRKPVSTLLETGLYGGDWKEVNIMNSYLPQWIKTPAIHIHCVLSGKQPLVDGKQTIKESVFGPNFRTNFPDAEKLMEMAKVKAEKYGVKLNTESKSAVAIFLAHIYAINNAESIYKTNRWVYEMDQALKKVSAAGHEQLVNDYLSVASKCIVTWMGMDPNVVVIGKKRTILLMILGISGATTKDQYAQLPSFLRGAI